MSDIEKELAELDLGKTVAKSAPEPEVSDDDDDDFVVVEVGEDGEPLEAADKGEERLSADQRDEDDREAIRESRRKERREKRERQKAARDASKATIDLLSRQLQETAARLAAIEGQSRQRQAQELDARLNNAARKFQEASAVLETAVSQNNGTAFVQAMQVKEQAEREYHQARELKQRLTTAPAASAPEPESDAIVQGFAQEFLERHSWIDLEGSDEASMIAQSIDQALVREGSDPADENHWVELERRLKRRIPEKFQAQETAKPARASGPPIGSGREHAPASTRKEVYVTPERRKHMEAAGYWDDPVKRKAMLKRYAEYDKANAAR